MNKNFSKFTLNIDQNDPIALSIAKSVEGVLKHALEPLQQEGQKVLRSSRSYSDNGLRSTDYYVESKYADLARQVAEEYISAQSDARGRDVRASFSPTTSSAFSVQRSTILDPAKRAALARTVIDNGGFFNRGSDGMVEWGVDSALRATSGTGREIPLTRQIRSSISSSNAAYRGRFEGLMKTVTGNDYSFSGYSDAERAALMRGARGVQMEGDRTQLNMLRARKRYEAKQQYAEAHPDDPLVKAARRRQNKKNISKVAGAARFARNAIGFTVAAILGSVMSVIGVLNKISDKITKIGETTRRQAMTDVRYNLPAGTIRNWEVFASKRVDVGNDLLPNAVNEIAQQFSSPLFYQSGTIQKIAPWLKEGTGNLMMQSSTGGDVNALGIASGVIDDLIDASLRGVAGSKTRLSRDQAFSENTQALVQLFPGLAELAQLYWRDFGKSKAASIADWKQEGIDGKTYSVTAERWLTQGGWSKEYSERSAPISSEAARAGSEETAETWANLKGTTAELVRQIFESVFGGSKFAQMAEDIRAILTKWVEPFFPQFAAKEQSRVIEANRLSTDAISKNIDWKKSEADKVAVSMGYKNAQSMVGDLTKLRNGDKKFISSLSTAQLAAFSDEENLYALASYLNDASLMELLAAENANTAKGKDAKMVSGTSAEQRAVDSGNFAGTVLRNVTGEFGARADTAGISGLFGKNLTRSDTAKLLADTPEGKMAREAFYGNVVPGISGDIAKLKDMGTPTKFQQGKYKKLFNNTLSSTLAAFDVFDTLEGETGNGFYGDQAIGMLVTAASLVNRFGDNAQMSAEDIASFGSKIAAKIAEKEAVRSAGGKAGLAARAAGSSKLVQLQDLAPVLESLNGSIGFNLSSFGGMTGATLGVNVNEEEAANSALATTTFTFTQIVNGKTVTKQTTLLSPFKKDDTLRSEGDVYQEFTNMLTQQ
jgi:hypothetical protein